MKNKKHENNDKVKFTRIKNSYVLNNFFSLVRRHNIAAHELHLLRSLTELNAKIQEIR